MTAGVMGVTAVATAMMTPEAELVRIQSRPPPKRRVQPAGPLFSADSTGYIVCNE